MKSQLFALRKRNLMIVFTILLVAAGILAYDNLGRLEDPTFTIKTAVVATSYPGASPAEVEEEVTDVIEEAIQEMGQVKEIYSTSQEGYSFVYVDMKDTFKSSELAQIWDELRRKVGDVQGELPPGAGPSVVNDDFGDVYGVFFALTGDELTNAELADYADILKKELLLCDDVAKIDMWGVRQEAIFVEFKRSQLVQLGVTPQQIMGTLQAQNRVQRSGKVQVGDNYLRISPSGDLNSEDQIADLLIGSARGMIRLSDVAHIYRDYIDPPRNMLRYNGKEGIGLGIATLDGGNVITMGDSIKARLKELAPNKPLHVEIHSIYYQSQVVTESVDTFIINLIEAVVIVIVLLMLFMGWRTGMLIGAVLLLTILATFVGMFVMGIDLQKVSLGALILALGMLVDNAIVVADGTLVRMEHGDDVETAADKTVKATIWPLLGATIVAILAFTAIGFAPGKVGEFCRSLFDVMALSLFISWILAISVTPLFCVWFLKQDANGDNHSHSRGMNRFYRHILHLAICYRWVVMTLTVVALGVALFGFGFIPKSFFPDSTQRYFYVNYWNPQGSHIDKTAADVAQIDTYVRGLDGVVNTTSFIGEGGMRFIISYDYQTPNSAYGQILVEVDDYHHIDQLLKSIETYMTEQFPAAEPYAQKIQTGPAIPYKIEARFRGPDVAVLKELATKAEKILADTGNARDLRTDWRHPVDVLRPQFAQTQARYAGITRSDVANALQWNFNGIAAGLYHEQDKLIPILFRSPENERASIDSLANMQIWSSLQNSFVPLRQVTTGILPVTEDALVKRRDRQRTITVQANPISGLPTEFHAAVRDQIESIELPIGYSMEWGGEFESSAESQAPLAKVFPICILGMFLIVVWLFNSFRRPLIIFLTVPLSLIGITAGLLLAGLPFGFMSILGFLGLSGMLIKNAIVLIDQIEQDLSAGIDPYKAVLDSSVSRMRPVLMASGTTIFGMAPLLFDAFYAAMAATIMSGLFAATFLTLIIVPVAYTQVYKIKADKNYV
ncbi:Multidrug efflux pump subunit AcrB [Desulfuromusa kysingii]|uniref:Multidrug efflux pump subunit AcrB n=1 Tax=Desulfuromusa kysingii TaxID=37625 RepID=A0A1H4ATB3_9BACT|nr:efflux RND transporter permease subunit [Desulfuromusa kysingii]SEA39175.1 Multidrug efflux pump subunit AcrB [Desulfuromusa kysingii]